MKKLFILLLVSFCVSLVQAQKTKTKSKELVYGADFQLTLNDTYIDGKLDNQFVQLDGTNSKIATATDQKKLFLATPEDAKLMLDSALRFLDLSIPGSTALYKSVQFYLPKVVTNKSLLILVSDYDTYHTFKTTQLKEMQQALIESLKKK